MRYRNLDRLQIELCLLQEFYSAEGEMPSSLEQIDQEEDDDDRDQNLVPRCRNRQEGQDPNNHRKYQNT